MQGIRSKRLPVVETTLFLLLSSGFVIMPSMIEER